jgi:signal transduction histidine kinase
MASTIDQFGVAANPTISLVAEEAERSRPLIARWLVAAVLSVAALGLTLALAGHLGQTIFVFFFGAIALTSWYSGLAPAIAVILFGVTATNYFLVTPRNQFHFDSETLVSMVALTAISLMVAWLTDSLNRTRAALSLHAEQLQSQARELEAQYEESQMLTEELETSNIELGEAVERAESASRAKTDFLAVMSHELRTPLNAIVGYADLLQMGVSGPLTDTQKTHLSRIRSSSFHLLDLIQDVLSFSRIEAGREELRVADVEVQQLARDAFSYIEQQCAAKGLHAELRLPESRLVMVTDPAKVRQILLNLLNNACKFTDAGAVRMRVHKDGDDIVFTIEDTGPGIAPEHAELIFEPFTQIDQSTTRIKGGAGLGLPVSRRLAHLLGGTLDVDTSANRGSTFVLRLPIRARLG